MKMVIDQKALAEAARWTSRHLPQKAIMPALACLLLEAKDDGTVTVSGFDLDTSTRAVLDADVLEAGTTLVSGRLLADVTAALDPGPVEFVADDTVALVATPCTRFSLPVMELRDYPALPATPAASGHVNGPLFAAAVAHAVGATTPLKDAVGNMEGFSGVRLTATGERLVIEATDRYRFMGFTLPWSPAGPVEGRMLIPAQAIGSAAKVLGEGDEVRLAFPAGTETTAGMQGAGREFTTRTLAAGFPDIDKIKPNPSTATGYLEFEPGALAAAAKKAALVNDANHPVRVTVHHGHATVTGGTSGPTGSTDLDVDADGIDEGFSLAFNPAFLASVLAPIEGTARMWLWTKTKPVLIQPADLDGSYWAAVMPVRLP